MPWKLGTSIVWERGRTRLTQRLERPKSQAPQRRVAPKVKLTTHQRRVLMNRSHSSGKTVTFFSRLTQWKSSVNDLKSQALHLCHAPAPSSIKLLSDRSRMRSKSPVTSRPTKLWTRNLQSKSTGPSQRSTTTLPQRVARSRKKISRRRRRCVGASHGLWSKIAIVSLRWQWSRPYRRRMRLIKMRWTWILGLIWSTGMTMGRRVGSNKRKRWVI